jgi:hypothetical protein
MIFTFYRTKWVKVVSLFAFIVSLFSNPSNEANGQTPPPPNQVQNQQFPSFDEQWKVFKTLGFELTSESLIADFEKLKNQKLIVDRPSSYLYMELGRTIQREPWTPFTNRLWDFDTEAIEDHGDYVEIMRNLQRISRGELKFDNLKDYVDLEEGKAWVSFSINGQDFRWDLVVDDDWVDPQLFSNVVELTRTLNTKGRFTYFDTGGQNFVVGFETPESRAAIVKATGLRVEWLD